MSTRLLTRAALSVVMMLGSVHITRAGTLSFQQRFFCHSFQLTEVEALALRVRYARGLISSEVENGLQALFDSTQPHSTLIGPQGLSSTILGSRPPYLTRGRTPDGEGGGERNTTSRPEHEPQLKQQNRYAHVLRQLLHGPLVSSESIKRRSVIRRIGSELETYVRLLLESPTIRIAIVPLGSSLKGHATKTSDVEFTVCILDGFDGDVGKSESEKILRKGIALLWREGFIGEPALPAITSVMNFTAAVEIQLGRNFEDRDDALDYFRADDEWALLFAPFAYCDPRLLEVARRNFLSFLKEHALDDPVWQFIQREYLDIIEIEADRLIETASGRRWLKKLGALKVGQVVESVLAKRREELALPRFDEMESIYLKGSQQSFHLGIVLLVAIALQQVGNTLGVHEHVISLSHMMLVASLSSCKFPVRNRWPLASMHLLRQV